MCRGFEWWCGSYRPSFHQKTLDLLSDLCSWFLTRLPWAAVITTSSRPALASRLEAFTVSVASWLRLRWLREWTQMESPWAPGVRRWKWCVLLWTCTSVQGGQQWGKSDAGVCLRLQRSVQQDQPTKVCEWGLFTLIYAHYPKENVIFNDTQLRKKLSPVMYLSINTSSSRVSNLIWISLTSICDL